ncbi:transcriptional repressor [Oribacterium sp. C9]|uniref:Fur family transcriptional regulator n=1 Tax=Oribacterium sp. C9 TaxID=1943579 RepID=UPI00098F07C9|nr:transcriptional repressor [Oribacterium sp. C9]OON87934.1 transcriptional repressor [Oribacterium sp. C9]
MNYSRQREEVQEQLGFHHDHPSADVIYSELREKDPTISLATVYRNLKLLAQNGVIRRLTFVSGADRFEPNINPHYHFVCDCCGKVFDVPMQAAETLDEAASKYISGKITGHDLVFHGICDGCNDSCEYSA